MEVCDGTKEPLFTLDQGSSTEIGDKKWREKRGQALETTTTFYALLRWHKRL